MTPSPQQTENVNYAPPSRVLVEKEFPANTDSEQHGAGTKNGLRPTRTIFVPSYYLFESSSLGELENKLLTMGHEVRF
jgi:hypothetical protein